MDPYDAPVLPWKHANKHDSEIQMLLYNTHTLPGSIPVNMVTLK